MSTKISATFKAAKSSAKRELGLFVCILIFSVVGALVVLPIIFVMSLLPDWTWWIWGSVFLVWLIFGDSIASAVRAYRGAKP